MSDGDWYARFAAQAVDVEGPDLDLVREAASDAGTWVALGITERLPSGTLNNSLVYIDAAGEIAGLHRKLIPTGAERLVWGNGHENLLTVVDIGGVRVGTLICWENYMPLARAALYEKGIDVLLSTTWDNSDTWVPTLRHIAKEGQIFVVGVTASGSADRTRLSFNPGNKPDFPYKVSNACAEVSAPSEIRIPLP